MSECIRWESVIPNFQEGDIITPFESKFKRQRDADYVLDGGINHNDSLEECASVKRKNSQKVGVYDKKGHQILPEEFDECKVIIYNSGDFYLSAILVQKQGLYGLYSKKGQIIVPTKYERVYIEDYAVIVMNEKKLYGAYSSQGKKIVNCEYDQIIFKGSLDDGYGRAITRKNNLFGIISEDGAEIIPLKFRRISENHYGGSGYIVYNATDPNIMGWYSRDGKSNIPCIFKNLKFNSSYPNLNIEVETPDGLKGIYSYGGKEIVPPKFKTINCIGIYIVGLIGDDKLSVYDWNGVCLYHTTE